MGRYYRTVVSSEVFHKLDNYVWKLTYRWVLLTHRNKPKRWIVQRYFGQFNTAGGPGAAMRRGYPTVRGLSQTRGVDLSWR